MGDDLELNPYYKFEPTIPSTTSSKGGNKMPLDIGLILAIVEGLNLLMSLFKPSQEKLMEKQGEVTTKTQKELMGYGLETQKGLMDYRMEMARNLGINPPYQSPYLGEVDPVIAKALMANLGRTSNWGWPAGQGIDTDFITQALSNMANIPSVSTGSSQAFGAPRKVHALGWTPPPIGG